VGSNPAKTAEQLAQEIDRALSTLTLTVARRADLEKLKETATDVAATLRHFNEEFVPLDLDDDDESLLNAYQQWSVVSPGVLRPGNGTLERLVSQSAPLRRLHQTGINIRSIKKYSPREIAFASLLGDNFSDLKEPWERIKKGISQKTISPTFRRKSFENAQKFFKELEALRLVSIEGYEVLEFNKDGKKWEPLTGPVPRKFGPNAPLRVKLKKVSSENQSLFTGEWLNAYAAELVHDHLTRNEVAHEIYTNVAYQAPQDIIHVSGDFDVIVEAEDLVAVFECKSGTLDASRGSFNEIIEKANGLRRVFELTKSTVPLRTLLIFNPEATSAEEVERSLAGSEIQAVTPDQVRGLTMELFSVRAS
jgi:hypothetical protein